jgi:deazaflavin-dependent oxidoreductase (nitroreductase family)
MRIGRGLIVAGTNGGLAPVPGWVWNLRADPRCQVEAGRERFTATAEFLEGAEYQTHWTRLVSEYPVYQTARDMLERHVPLVVFHPTKE